jgi:hypothetical protein
VEALLVAVSLFSGSPRRIENMFFSVNILTWEKVLWHKFGERDVIEYRTAFWQETAEPVLRCALGHCSGAEATHLATCLVKIKENDEHCLIFGFGIIIFGFEIELLIIALTTVSFLGPTETDTFHHR